MIERIKLIGAVMILAADCGAAESLAPNTDSKPCLRQPAISPDGQRVAFIYGGDIFEVAVSGGVARRLTDGSSTDSRPRYSPDGDHIAFSSNRTGAGDVYVLDRATLCSRRVTFHDGQDSVESWSADGSEIVFSSDRLDPNGYADIFAVPMLGGMPRAIIVTPFHGGHSASVSPDGKSIVFNSGDRVRDWWRLGPHEAGGPDVWIADYDVEDPGFTRITSYPGKNRSPLWDPDGEGIYFVTDEGNPSGAENIVLRSFDGTQSAVTSFEAGHVLWPDIAGNGSVVFEREFRIWHVSRSSVAAPIPIELPVEPRESTARFEEVSDGVSEFEVSPDGEKLAFVVHSDIFLQSTSDRSIGPFRLTETATPESRLSWGPDGCALAFVRANWPDGDRVVVLDAATGEERLALEATSQARSPLFSPDGSSILYLDGAESLQLVDIESGERRTAASFFMMHPLFDWAPDGTAFAFSVIDENGLANLFVRDSDLESEPRQVSFVPHAIARSLFWTSDSKSLIFSTQHERPNGMVFRIDLEEEMPSRTSRGRAALFNLDKDERDHPVAIETGPSTRPDNKRLFESQRDIVCFAMGPAPDSVLIRTDIGGTRGLWLGDSTGRSDRLTEFSRGWQFGDLQSVNGEVWFLENGGIIRIDEQHNRSSVDTTVVISVDDSTKYEETLLDAARALSLYHREPSFNGYDLPSLVEDHLPFARGARTDDDFVAIAMHLFGWLNVSHLHIRPTSRPDLVQTADLGLGFDSNLLRETGQLVVSSVVPNGPAANAQTPIETGDILVAVDGIAVGRDSNLHEVLIGKSRKMLTLSIERNVHGHHPAEMLVEIDGASSRSVRALRYEQWAQANAEYVDSKSDGRVAYIHVRHFGTGALEQLMLDIDTEMHEAEGLIFDIRGNGGGWAAAAVTSLLERKITSISSNRDRTLPNEAILGVKVLDRPLVLLQNEQCLSNSEAFSHRWRVLRLGPIVGTPTAAFLAGSFGYQTYSGFSMGMSAWSAYDIDGNDMDRVPQLPDIHVDYVLGSKVGAAEPQLTRAINELLALIDEETTR